MNDEVFLAKLASEPADDVTRLVYADWLEEQGEEAKAEFLRATVELHAPETVKGRRRTRRRRLRKLAADLDTSWLAVVSRLAVENCQGKSNAEEGRFGLDLFEFVCDRRWEDLSETDDRAVRFCDGCRQRVYYCDTINEARRHAARDHCVAIDLGIERRKGDLRPPVRQAFLGMISPTSLAGDEERQRPDPVSAAREERKREATGKA